MNILLVRPKTPKESISLSEVYITEPFELEYLYSVLSEEHNVVIADLQMIRKPFSKILAELKDIHAVCFSGYMIHVDLIKHLARQVKDHCTDTAVLVGGVHAEWCPEDFVSQYIDIVVKRFALVSFKRIISLISEGRLDQAKRFDFELPDKKDGCFRLRPDRNCTLKWRDGYSYFLLKPAALLRTSYGCPYKCSFCIRWQISGGHLILLPVDDIIEEIREIREDNIFIIDDNFLMNPQRLEEFITKFERSGMRKRFLSYARIDFILQNEGLIRRLSSIGFTGFLIGVESHRQKDLDEYGKPFSPEDVIRVSEMLKKYDLDFYASLIVKPDMDVPDFAELRKFLKKARFDFVNIQPFIPFRKTPQFEQLKDRIMVSEKDYPKWDFSHQVLRPDYLPPSRFALQIFLTYLDFYWTGTSRPMHKMRKYGYKVCLSTYYKSFKLFFRYIGMIWDTYIHYD